MFDMKALTPRYFEIRFRNGLKLEVEPPKLKTLKQIISITKVETNGMTEDSLTGLFEGLALALSKNKQNKKIAVEFVEEQFNLSEVQEFLTAYFNWVGEIQNSKN